MTSDSMTAPKRQLAGRFETLRSARLAMLALFVSISACAHSPMRAPDEQRWQSKPFVVLERRESLPYLRQVQTCGGAFYRGIEDFWSPDAALAQEVDKAVWNHFAGLGDTSAIRSAGLGYYRQILGVSQGGVRKIAVIGIRSDLIEPGQDGSFTSANVAASWERVPITLCDVTRYQFFAEYDPASKRILHFAFGQGP